MLEWVTEIFNVVVDNFVKPVVNHVVNHKKTYTAIVGLSSVAIAAMTGGTIKVAALTVAAVSVVAEAITVAYEYFNSTPQPAPNNPVDDNPDFSATNEEILSAIRELQKLREHLQEIVKDAVEEALAKKEQAQPPPKPTTPAPDSNNDAELMETLRRLQENVEVLLEGQDHLSSQISNQSKKSNEPAQASTQKTAGFFN